MIIGEWGTKPAVRRKIKVARNKRARDPRLEGRGSEKENGKGRGEGVEGGTERKREASESAAPVKRG